MDFLAHDIVFLIVIHFDIDHVKRIIVLKSISRELRRLIDSAVKKADSAFWERLFKNVDPILHAQFSSASASGRSLWFDRLNSYFDLKRRIDSRPHLFEPSWDPRRCIDLILHRHPTKGFSLNVEIIMGSLVVVIGINHFSDDGTSPFHDLIERLEIPMWRESRDDEDDDASVLILHSINDVCVSETRNYSGLLSFLDCTGCELYHLRFVFCSWHLAPTECRFGGNMGGL